MQSICIRFLYFNLQGAILVKNSRRNEGVDLGLCNSYGRTHRFAPTVRPWGLLFTLYYKLYSQSGNKYGLVTIYFSRCLNNYLHELYILNGIKFLALTPKTIFCLAPNKYYRNWLKNRKTRGGNVSLTY